jgi:hypothetical protein
MSTHILQKCLEELNKEVPRKDYVIGMLETLIAMKHEPLPITSVIHEKPVLQTVETASYGTAGDDILRAYSSGPVAGLSSD